MVMVNIQDVVEAMANIFSQKELRVITRVTQALATIGLFALVVSLFYMAPVAVNFSPQTAGIVFGCNLLLVFFFARFCRIASLAVSLLKEAANE